VALLPLKTLRVWPLFRHLLSLPLTLSLVLLPVVVEIVDPKTGLLRLDLLRQKLLHLLLLAHRYLESPMTADQVRVRIYAGADSSGRRVTHVVLSVLGAVLGGGFIIFVGPGQL